MLLPTAQAASNSIQSEIRSSASHRHLSVLYGSMPLLGSSIGIDDVQAKQIVTATVDANDRLLQRIQHSALPSQIELNVLLEQRL